MVSCGGQEMVLYAKGSIYHEVAAGNICKRTR